MGTRNLLIAWALGFCALTLLVLLWTVVSVAPTGKALPSAVAGVSRSPGLVTAIAYFFAVYVGLHVLLAVTWEWLSRPVILRAGSNLKAARHLMVLSFLPLAFGILLANRRLFPDSTFAADLAPPVELAADALLWLIVAYAAVIAAAGLVRRGWRAGIVVGASLLLFAVVDGGGIHGDASGAARESPDIVIIGIDGLRPDHVDPRLTPAIDALLAGSVRYDRAWTPMARTFPAWVSILTGQYPSAHGADFNLVPRGSVDDARSLAHQLGERGYHRIYAIDETRFSNIDGSYGFDRIVAPATGAFDFLLTAVGDLPLANLVVATYAGRWLFPYAYMNRGMAVSYRPQSFDGALARAVARSDAARPLFLVAHFELPHWPYTWADSGSYAVQVPESLRALAPRNYHAAVARADAQVGALVAALERAGRLDNTALVLLSDHGEAFRGIEAPWRDSETGSALEVHAGHGTHVLSTVQSRVLLAFRGYGHAMLPPAPVRGPATITASLVDVRPTLHHWLGVPPPAGIDLDGASLLGDAGAERVVTIETGFSPPSVAEGAPDAAALLAESARYYDVDARGRLSLRNELLPELRAAKQRAAISGDWLLAALPGAGGPFAWNLILANHARREFWSATGSTLPADAPVVELLETLCRRFGDPDVFAPPQCVAPGG